jgi:hypothetical protein
MGSSTNTPFILAVFAFYAFLTLVMGMVGQSMASNDPAFIGTNYTRTSSNSAPDTSGFWGTLASLMASISLFTQGVFYSLEALTFVGTALLFAPLGLTFFYVIASFARGSS